MGGPGSGRRPSGAASSRTKGSRIGQKMTGARQHKGSTWFKNGFGKVRTGGGKR